jgi:hypothetical protein
VDLSYQRLDGGKTYLLAQAGDEIELDLPAIQVGRVIQQVSLDPR